jgi:outer membrane biosynthesis protein TonB
MSTTQIPPQEPATPSGAPLHHETDLYDSRRWESAYRDWHATPELLIQLQDELDRSRMREAFWISVIVHLLVAITVFTSPVWGPRFDRWWAKIHPQRAVLLVSPANTRDKELTYLALPPDAQKLTRKPNTNIISDKDRMAMKRSPQLDRQELRRILDSSRPGRPGPPSPQGPAPQPSPPAAAQAAPPQAQQQQQQAAQARPPDQQNNQMAKLQPPPQPKVNFGAPQSAQSTIAEAARAAAANRSAGGNGGSAGDFGLGQGRQPTQAVGGLDVLSDTMGVDFGPYLDRVLHIVKQNWINEIPEGARYKKGKLAIEFAILKDGRVAGMQRVASSNDITLDRAAWGGITASNPFPPLPAEFKGQYLALRFYFYYNMDQEDLQ